MVARVHDAGDTTNLVTAALVRVEAGSGLGDSVADVLLQAGGVDVRQHREAPDDADEPDKPGVAGDDLVVSATFLRVTDATRAVVQLALGPRGGGGGPIPVAAGASAVLCTGDSGCSPVPADRAAVLLSRALPGQVLVTTTTAVLGGRSLPRGVELVDHGNVRLAAGLPPERAYQVRVEGDVPVDQRIGPSNLEWARRTIDGPVLGYDEPLAALVKAWKGVLDGRSRMVLLTGEAGPAATIVAAEAALRLHAEGAQVLYGRWDRSPATHDAVREALGVHADGCSGEALRADLDGWGDDIGRLLPDVGARVGGQPPRGAEPHVARSLLARAIESWLEAVARRRPTLLVLDDLHRADAASFPLLDTLRHGRGRGPLMILVTANLRSGDVASTRLEAFADGGDSAGFDHVRLRST
jgi:hypothetical protein